MPLSRFKKHIAQATLLILVIAFFFNAPLHCQSSTEYFAPTFFEKQLRINYTPFYDVEVLDNRFDTTNVLTVENGNYPALRINIDQPAAYTIKQYVLEAIAKLPKGDKTLLISLKQLRVTNKNYICRRVGDKTAWLPGGLVFEADLFYKIDKRRYRKIVTIHKTYYDEGPLQQAVATILNETIVAASNLGGNSENTITDKPKKLKYLSTDTASFVYARDTTSITLDQININQCQKWADYVINSSPIWDNGWYKNFDDFRDNKLTAGLVHMQWSDKDSAFILVAIGDSVAKFKNYFPWAVVDSGNIYMPLNGRLYVKLSRLDNTFAFYVPYTLTDMYAMLSMEKTNVDEEVPYESTGHIFADLIGSVVTGTINASFEKAKNKKIQKKGLNGNYRNCYIDMDTGDIVY